MPQDDTTAATASGGAPTDAETFVRVVFHGERFDGGIIPVEALPELAAYRDAIVAAAKGLFRAGNRGRRRVPKGFEASIRLVLAGTIQTGSAVAEVRRVRVPILRGGQETLPMRDEIDEAVDYVEQWFDAVVSETVFPNTLEAGDQRRVERALSSLGRHLLPGEALETRTTTRESGARYTTDERRKLAGRIGRQELEVDYENVAGAVTAVSTPEGGGQSFSLDLGDLGVHVDIPFDVDRHDPLALSVPDGGPIPVTVTFTAFVDPAQGRITRIHDVSNLTVDDGDVGSAFSPPDEASFDSAIVEFGSMADGWFDGIGRSPATAALSWAADALKEACSRGGLPLPWLYPTPEGGIRAEWEVERLRASAAFDPEDGLVRLFVTSLDDDEFDEVELALSDATADRLTEFLQRLAP